MKCDFCGHEVAPGTVECPYCHYQFKIDAQVLSPEERDTFDGVTIDESADTADDRSAKADAVYDSGADAYDSYNKRQRQVPPNIKVHTFGCGSGILITFLILCGIVAVIFFLLPTFIVFAAVGAIVLFIMRLFMGF